MTFSELLCRLHYGCVAHPRRTLALSLPQCHRRQESPRLSQSRWRWKMATLQTNQHQNYQPQLKLRMLTATEMS